MGFLRQRENLFSSSPAFFFSLSLFLQSAISVDAWAYVGNMHASYILSLDEQLAL